MAAIDPTAPPMEDEDTPAGPPRATLKLIRLPFDANSDDESGSDDDDYDEDDVAAIERRLGMTSDDEESSDEESNGGPGEKTKEARAAALLKALKEEAAAEEDEDIELTNGVNGTKLNKGKAKASDEEDSDEDSDESGEDLGIEEFVICTLDANQVCYVQTIFSLGFRQPLLDLALSTSS
jgi:FK506-binding nuclear protein